VEEYSNETNKLARRLLRLISESLGLEPSVIEDAIGDPSQNITINYYPPCPQPHLTLGLQVLLIAIIVLLMSEQHFSISLLLKTLDFQQPKLVIKFPSMSLGSFNLQL
jgi:hypothetical protein